MKVVSIGLRVLAGMIAVIVVVAPTFAQQVIPGVNFSRLVNGTATVPSRSYIQDTDLGSYRIGANNEGFTAGGTAVFDYNATRVRFQKPLNAADAAITEGSGTGITVVSGGVLARQVYKVTIASTAFVCAATTCDVTIATAPAKTVFLSAYADLTTVFACTATCTSSTLSMILGSTVGSNNILVSLDADAATAVFGDVDAELGALLARATAIQGGAVSWPGTGVVLRLTSGTGNIGNGAATNLSQGSITFYLVTERLP